MSSQVAAHQVADALSGGKKSPQDKLAEYQLMKEKMMVTFNTDTAAYPAQVKAVLGATSELERLHYAITAKLSNDPEYAQHTAKFQVLADAAGDDSYIGIGEYIAKLIYNKKRAEELVRPFAENVTLEKLATKKEFSLATTPLGGLFAALGFGA